MKIFHIITSLKLGGAEASLYNLLTYLKQNHKDQHQVAYFYYGPFVKKIEKLGIKTYKINNKFNTYDPWAYLCLKKMIQQFKPDILHSALWSANIVARLLSKQLNIPLMCDLHGNMLDEGKFRNYLDKLTAKIPKKIIAVAPMVKRSYQAAVIDRYNNKKIQESLQQKLVTIPNGIDAQALRSQSRAQPLRRTDFGLQDSDFVIGSVGRFEPIKSYDVLIKAFAQAKKKYNNIKLFLVGDGSERNKLEMLVRNLGIQDSVIFTGFRSDGYRFYPLFDCFALSSQSEGLSIALLEALSFSLPIIMTSVTKEHDVLVHGVNGLLVPVNDIRLYAQAIEMIVGDAVLQDKMKKENARLIECYSIKGMAEQYQMIYERLVHGVGATA